MLKECAPSICGRLACLFNASFKQCVVANEWKISQITPIFKKVMPPWPAMITQSPFSPSLLSYRNILFTQLLRHLSAHQAISDLQFGFWPGGSTQEALVSLTQRWHDHLEQGRSSLCDFLDLAKAFDKVPHLAITTALQKASVLWTTYQVGGGMYL